VLETHDPEVPEADALDQALPVSPGDEDDDYALVPPLSDLPADVPEADALEQAQPAGSYDDRYDGGE
jgi:hypothetical protein